MTIERDDWVYLHTTSPKRARNFFGRPGDTEIREERPNLYAIRLKAPSIREHAGGDQEFGLLQRFLRCRVSCAAGPEGRHYERTYRNY